MANPYTEDRGLIFRFNLGIDISGYSAVEILIKKPNLATDTWVCTVYDQTNGIISYTTPTGSEIFNGAGLTGTWTGQARLSFASGEIYHGDPFTFTVAEVMIPTP